MIIHSTQKLAKKLPDVSSEALTAASPLGSWHANLYLIDRRNCVMFCHDETRFSLFISALKKADFANLDFWFRDVYANTLLKLNFDTRLIEKGLAQITPLQFDTQCDRSVQGTMRIASYDLDSILLNTPNLTDLRTAPIYSISASLNDRPVRTKHLKSSDCIWPDKEMHNFLQNLPIPPTAIPSLKQ